MEQVSKESFSKNWDSRINKAMAMDASNSHSENWIKELGVSDSQQYQKSAQESLSTDKSYEEASQLQHQLGQALSTAPAVWANKLASSDAAMSTLQNVPYDSDFNQSVNNNVQRFQGQFANSKETLAAALVASHINTPTQQNFERLGKALGQAGLTGTSESAATPLANQALKENELPRVAENIFDKLTTPKAANKQQIEQHISGARFQPDRVKSLSDSFQNGSHSLSGKFEHSDQNKSQVTGLLTQSSFGRNPSTEGKGLNMTSSEAFDKAIEYGLTPTQASMFSSLVKDRNPSYERSAEPEDRSHRLGQAIAEVSRGWGEQGATLGWHAFNHLTHAADHPEHTHSALTLIGEMNRVYQPELKEYDQSVDSYSKGRNSMLKKVTIWILLCLQSILAQELKKSCKLGKRKITKGYLASNVGRFQESSSRFARAVREKKMIYPILSSQISDTYP